MNKSLRLRHLSSSDLIFRALAVLVLFVPLNLMGSPIHFDVRIQSEPTDLFKLPRKHLYAAGLSLDGSDVIVIANGNIYAARVNSSGKMIIDSSVKTRTSDLLYSNIARWTEVPLSEAVADRKQLHEVINQTLVKFGFNNPGTVPFLLKGRFKNSSFVAPKTGGTSELSRANAEALMVGFFTKKSDVELKSVIHALFEKPQAVGRIDSLTIQKDRVTLYLPK